MKRFFSAILCAALLLSLLAGCASDSTPSGSAADQPPASTAAPAPTTTAAPETTAAPTTAAPTEPAHTNERGPFDEEHYQIGLRALQAVDGFLDGTLTISEVNRVLSSCYEKISALPKLPESDSLYAGNDFVKSYVFLAQIDFEMQMSDFSTKKYEDRNYLAAAIGEPEKDFSPVFSTEAVNAFLDDAFASLRETFPDSRFTYIWNDGDLFLDFNIPSFDYYYQNKASLSAEDRATVREISHGYVSGDVAQSLYDQIRSIGGSGFDVYITLGGCALFCSSRNLQIFMDPLNE